MYAKRKLATEQIFHLVDTIFFRKSYPRNPATLISFGPMRPIRVRQFHAHWKLLPI
jgi:hypothetical protein